jgi:hypothetical protein
MTPEPSRVWTIYCWCGHREIYTYPEGHSGPGWANVGRCPQCQRPIVGRPRQGTPRNPLALVALAIYFYDAARLALAMALIRGAVFLTSDRWVGNVVLERESKRNER